MLYVKFAKLPGYAGWHVGSKLNIPYVTHVDSPLDITDTVESVQADGDELQHVYANTRNIPGASSSVVTWSGETAQFIFDNVLNKHVSTADWRDK